jgi:signal transduction histidine kinase
VSPAPAVARGWQALFPARAGGLWILDGDRMRRWNDGQWAEDRGSHDWGTIILSAFLESRSGKIIGGSFKEGVHTLDPQGQFEELSEANGLTHSWAYCLAEDREGNIWVGTGNGGLNVLYPRRVTMVGTPQQWLSSAVLSVSPSSDAGLWIGTEGAGVFRLLDGELIHLPSGEQLWQSVANSVMEDRSGRLWVGTWGSGARVLENGVFRNTYDLNPPQRVALTVFESATGDIWVGTKGGAGRLRNEIWTWLESGEHLPRAAVRCFAETDNGVIWIGLDGGGVARWQAGDIRVFRRADGLSSDYVRTLFADADQSVWIGTRGGLSRYKDGKFSSVTTRQGLPSDVICQIVDDGSGHFWMSSLGGLFRVDKRELNRCADGQISAVTCLVCDSSGGLATLEMSEQGQPAGCRTPDGRLWFATGRGLAMVIPDRVSPNLLPPPVKIEEVLVDGAPVELPASSDEVSVAAPESDEASIRRRVSIPAGGRQFEFRYTALSLSNPGGVAFRYRLEGLHQDWVEAGTRRSAFYTDLPPRDYVFRVMARNADGIWSEQGAALMLRVLPHFWQTWWFKAGSRGAGAVAVGLTVLIVVRRRARRRVEHLERQRAIERERARIARDIHDDLGSNLTRIVMLSESARGSLAEAQRAEADLEEICQTGRELTLQLSEIVWAVNPEHDTLDSFVTYIGKYAHDFLRAAGVRCRLDLPLTLPGVALDSPMRHHLFLAFKEALNNAVRHAKPASVLVTLQVAEDSFTLAVQDDGCGLESRGTPPTGHGIGNMKRRLAEVGGRCTTGPAPGGGTYVRLTVPLPLRK